MFIDELKDYIVSNTSLVFGTTLFIGQLPEGVTSCVVLSEGNTDNIYQQGNTKGYYIKNIPIRIRGTQNELATRTIANNLMGVLENLYTDLPNYKIIRGVFETPLYQLDGTDPNNNYIYAGMYQCIIEDILQ
jgi:hypothetical protein